MLLRNILHRGTLTRVHRHSVRALSSKSIASALKDNAIALVEATKSSIFGLMVKNMDEKSARSFLAHWNERIGEKPAPKAQEIGSQPPTIVVTSEMPLKPAPKPEPVGGDWLVSAAKDKVLFHPLLGELVAELDYKRVYLTNVASLARTPVWKKQRILRPERAALIADDKVRKGLQSSLPGVITVYEDVTSREIGIIDGQHRAGALMILAQRGHWNENERNVIIEVFSTNSEESISSLFSAINAAEPVRLIDLLDSDDAEDEEERKMGTEEESLVFAEKEVGKGEREELYSSSTPSSSLSSSQRKSEGRLKDAEAKEIVSTATDSLRQRYPEMFKPTSRCKVPHVNIDVLRDDLYSTAVKQGKYRNSEQLLQQLDKINQQLATKFAKLATDDAEAKRFTKLFQTALQKAKTNGFYLGMEKDWLYDVAMWEL